MDAANIDLKAFTDRFYRKVTGGQLAPVLETLEYLVRETDVWVEITTLLIPGENDSNAEVDAMTSWVADRLGVSVPMHFTAFHPDWKMRNTPRTPSATLTRARVSRSSPKVVPVCIYTAQISIAPSGPISLTLASLPGTTSKKSTADENLF